VLPPHRKEDADEVKELVKHNGGVGKILLGFYPGKSRRAKEPWEVWRLEGPGLVWKYRVLPHVPTYVHISSKVGTPRGKGTGPRGPAGRSRRRCRRCGSGP